jgi:3-aminobutyryl-CoA ammonia-lyase
VSAVVGQAVTHRRYVTAGDAHYGGNLVDGAYVLGLFGDVGTELSIRADGDEGLFASYSDVQFRAPVLAGDVIEVTATVIRVGRRSREIAFEARVLAEPNRSAAHRPPVCWTNPWWWSPQLAPWWCPGNRRPAAPCPGIMPPWWCPWPTSCGCGH